MGGSLESHRLVVCCGSGPGNAGFQHLEVDDGRAMSLRCRMPVTQDVSVGFETRRDALSGKRQRLEMPPGNVSTYVCSQAVPS